jgi:hypothetical protein
LSAVTLEEWRESQPGSFMNIPNGNGVEQVVSIDYKSSWGLLLA